MIPVGSHGLVFLAEGQASRVLSWRVKGDKISWFGFVCRSLLFKSDDMKAVRANKAMCLLTVEFFKKKNKTFGMMSVHLTHVLFPNSTNVVMNYSEIESKVREATNDDPWGPSGQLMGEIAK